MARVAVVVVVLGIALVAAVRSPDGWSGLGLIGAVIVALPAAGPLVIEWEGSLAYGAIVACVGLLLAAGTALIWVDADTFTDVFRGGAIPFVVAPIVAVGAGAAIVYGVREGIDALNDS